MGHNSRQGYFLGQELLLDFAAWIDLTSNAHNLLIFTIQYPVPLLSLCTKSLIAVLKDAKQLSEENGGGPFW